MSEPETPSERPSRPTGRTTSGQGTPMAVDVSTHRRAKTLIALFLAAPLIWSAHFIISYLAVEAGCTGDGPGLEQFEPPVPTVVTLAATVVAAVACLAVAALAYRRWRADQHEHDEGRGLEPPDRGGALAFAGFLLSLLGFISVLFVGLPAVVLPACSP